MSAAPGTRRLALAPDACADDRYPALTGAWAVGCSASGNVDLAVHLETGSTVVLVDAVPRPGLADGSLYDPREGVWVLPAARPTRVTPRVTDPPIAPPAFDGLRVALSYPDGVELFALGDSVRKRHPAKPRPWVAPALRWPDVAWQDAAGPRLRTVDGVVHAVTGDGKAPDRGVGSDGARVWFSGPGASVWVDRQGRSGLGGPTDAGFDAPVAVAGPVWCAERRPGHATPGGVACGGAHLPEGVALDGHDHPSVSGPWLLTRAGGDTWLTTFTTVHLTSADARDGSRAPPVAGCEGPDPVWDLRWPARGWEVVFQTGDGGEVVAPLSPGEKVLTAPCAVSAHLREEGA